MAKSGPRARLQELQNSRSWIFVKSQTLSARYRHWRNSREKNYRDRCNIKARVLVTLTGAVPRKMAEGRHKGFAPARIVPMSPCRQTYCNLNHWAIDSFRWISRPGTKYYFLNANLWSIHIIAFDIDWSWNIFTLHNFCSLLIEQLINLEKVIVNWVLEIYDRSSRSSYGWLVSNTIDDCLQSKIAQKIFTWNLKVNWELEI